jgi:hypothetical protein
MFGGPHTWSRLGKRVVPSGSFAASSVVVLAYCLAVTRRDNEDKDDRLVALCDARRNPSSPFSNPRNNESSSSPSSFAKKEEDITAYYRKYGRFHPQRQIHEPFLPYPAWDYNWDGRQTPFTSPEFLMHGSDAFAASKTHGTTRHILLIRHGQYDESASHDDHQQRLTPLGRHQAALTGQRLAIVARGGLHDAGLVGSLSSKNDSDTNKTNDDLNFQQQQQQPCRIKAIHVSDMTRAKETAEIIASFLAASDNVNPTICTKPDPLLNEALPSP